MVSLNLAENSSMITAFHGEKSCVNGLFRSRRFFPAVEITGRTRLLVPATLSRTVFAQEYVQGRSLRARVLSSSDRPVDFCLHC
uniref:Uncharacterized protein n=1 Tax=Candidatus Kentrum sp. LFY TaxID=2126342 RepID=A0A450WRP7_9GAMM|nr:MAG: hypothetical protein BECKLFY1418C_GA0070996_10623 [Candidatus Kentron sp. LFY]